MHVLVIAQYFPPDIGGSATRAYNVARGLVLNGCKVTVVAAFPHYPEGKIPREYKWRPLKVEWLDGFRVIKTFMPPIKSKGFFRRLLLIGSFAVSSVFALPLVGRVDAIWGSSWVPGIFYKNIKRKPLVLNEDDLTLEDIVDLGLVSKNSSVLKVAEKIYRLCLSKADAVTPISPGYVKVLSEKYSVDRRKIKVVRGGVDLSMFKASPNSMIAGRKFVVLYSGAFSVAYDFEQLLRAAKIVEEEDAEIEFVLQGKGELAGFVRSKEDELNVKNVRIVEKLLRREEVAELLAQADVLVLPLAEFKTPYRGMSSKLYEYQAAGKPIICSSRGLPKDYVKETDSGLAVEPGDYEAFAKAVMNLKENPKLAQIMGENGRKYVEAEASIEAIGLQMKEIFETIIQDRVYET